MSVDEDIDRRIVFLLFDDEILVAARISTVFIYQWGATPYRHLLTSGKKVWGDLSGEQGHRIRNGTSSFSPWLFGFGLPGWARSRAG